LALECIKLLFWLLFFIRETTGEVGAVLFEVVLHACFHGFFDLIIFTLSGLTTVLLKTSLEGFLKVSFVCTTDIQFVVLFFEVCLLEI
jgi:hypothetical protein